MGLSRRVLRKAPMCQLKLVGWGLDTGRPGRTEDGPMISCPLMFTYTHTCDSLPPAGGCRQDL